MKKSRTSAITLSTLARSTPREVAKTPIAQRDQVVQNSSEKRFCNFSLPYPPSANRYWRVYKNMVVKSDIATAYQHEVRMLLRMAGHEPMLGDISVTMIVYRPRNQGDLDNRIKVLLDAMNGVIYMDDEQVSVIHAERRYDKKNPRVDLIVEQI